jgi:hypothetical protein
VLGIKGPEGLEIGLVEAYAVVGDGEAVDVARDGAVFLIQREAWRGALDLDLDAPFVRSAAGLLNGMYRIAHCLKQRHQAVRRRERDISHPAGQVGSDHRCLIVPEIAGCPLTFRRRRDRWRIIGVFRL